MFVPKNIPNILTLIRLIASPLILPLLIVYLMPYNQPMVNWLLAFCFVLINLTDFFDGYLARKYKYETKIGKLLDPIADKFLLFSTLIALVAIKKIFFYWAIILIGREFFIMGLRIVGLEHDVNIQVNFLGKLKTFIITAYITAVLINPYSSLTCSFWSIAELIFLGASLALSVISAYVYLRIFAGNINIIQ